MHLRLWYHNAQHTQSDDMNKRNKKRNSERKDAVDVLCIFFYKVVDDLYGKETRKETPDILRKMNGIQASDLQWFVLTSIREVVHCKLQFLKDQEHI